MKSKWQLNIVVYCAVVPEQPRDLRGEAMSSTTIQLEWTAPHTVGSDPVTSYELYYNDSTRRQNVHLTISAPVNSYLLEDLSPNSVYHIRILATTSHGEGPTTAAISVHTKEDGELMTTYQPHFEVVFSSSPTVILSTLVHIRQPRHFRIAIFTAGCASINCTATQYRC